MFIVLLLLYSYFYFMQYENGFLQLNKRVILAQLHYMTKPQDLFTRVSVLNSFFFFHLVFFSMDTRYRFSHHSGAQCFWNMFPFSLVIVNLFFIWVFVNFFLHLLDHDLNWFDQ